jgi:hypothetical protein
VTLCSWRGSYRTCLLTRRDFRTGQPASLFSFFVFSFDAASAAVVAKGQFSATGCNAADLGVTYFVASDECIEEGGVSSKVTVTGGTAYKKQMYFDKLCTTAATKAITTATIGTCSESTAASFLYTLDTTALVNTGTMQTYYATDT